MPTESTALSTLQCTRCGSALPDEAKFCLKCGNAVKAPMVIEAEPLPKPSRPLRVRPIVGWTLLALLLAGIVWATSSDNPYAQAIQEFVGWKHDQAILDNPFSVSPHNFRYYKFALPEASTNVAIVGQFSATSDDKNRNIATKDADNGIEVYVLSESAFAIWQNGYATGSVYESGRVPSGEIHADLPPGAGIYYLIFNNKFSIKTPKSVNATVLLRYKSWLPEWLRRMKNSVWNWIGL